MHAATQLYSSVIRSCVRSHTRLTVLLCCNAPLHATSRPLPPRQELALLKDGAARFTGGRSGASKTQEGDVADLTGARLVTTMIVNGVPRTAVELVEGVRKLRCARRVCAAS